MVNTHGATKTGRAPSVRLPFVADSKSRKDFRLHSSGVVFLLIILFGKGSEFVGLRTVVVWSWLEGVEGLEGGWNLLHDASLVSCRN